jgi:protein-disulfide isomerase
MSVRIATLVACTLFFLLGCETREGADPNAGVAADTAAAADSEVVARIGDQTIHADELDEWIKEDLFNRETAGGNGAKIYEVRSQALARMVQMRVFEAEAARRNTTEDELLAAEIAALGPVTEEEIDAFYQERIDQMSGLPLEQLSGRISEYLQQQKGLEVIEKLVSAAGVEILLRQPRVEIAADGPSKGPADAAVTIIEFSDFQCPYCSRALPVLQEVMDRYPDDVRLVYRHLPLDSIHPRARVAAEASLCAEEQGKFWEYHDILFANNSALSDEDLRGNAETIGLDVEGFVQCMSEERFAVKVEADLEAGRAVGLSGTPAFFVNGLLLSGARPVEDFVRVIDEELGRGESAASDAS